MQARFQQVMTELQRVVHDTAGVLRLAGDVAGRRAGIGERTKGMHRIGSQRARGQLVVRRNLKLTELRELVHPRHGDEDFVLRFRRIRVVRDERGRRVTVLVDGALILSMDLHGC